MWTAPPAKSAADTELTSSVACSPGSYSGTPGSASTSGVNFARSGTPVPLSVTVIIPLSESTPPVAKFP